MYFVYSRLGVEILLSCKYRVFVLPWQLYAQIFLHCCAVLVISLCCCSEPPDSNDV